MTKRPSQIEQSQRLQDQCVKLSKLIDVLLPIIWHHKTLLAPIDGSIDVDHYLESHIETILTSALPKQQISHCIDSYEDMINNIITVINIESKGINNLPIIRHKQTELISYLWEKYNILERLLTSEQLYGNEIISEEQRKVLCEFKTIHDNVTLSTKQEDQEEKAPLDATEQQQVIYGNQNDLLQYLSQQQQPKVIFVSPHNNNLLNILYHVTQQQQMEFVQPAQSPMKLVQLHPVHLQQQMVPTQPTNNSNNNQIIQPPFPNNIQQPVKANNKRTISDVLQENADLLSNNFCPPQKNNNSNNNQIIQPPLPNNIQQPFKANNKRTISDVLQETADLLSNNFCPPPKKQKISESNVPSNNDNKKKHLGASSNSNNAFCYDDQNLLGGGVNNSNNAFCDGVQNLLGGGVNNSNNAFCDENPSL